jgi:hypothetical protein
MGELPKSMTTLSAVESASRQENNNACVHNLMNGPVGCALDFSSRIGMKHRRVGE